MSIIDNKNILVWGYGEYGKLVIKIMKDYKLQPKAIFDNDEAKQNNSDLKIYGADEASKYDDENTIVVICVARHNIPVIEEQLKSLFKKTRIYNYQHLINHFAKLHYNTLDEKWSIDYQKEVDRWLKDFDNEFVWHECAIKQLAGKKINRHKTIEQLKGFEIKSGDTLLDIGCGGIVKYTNSINGVEIDYQPVDALKYMYEYAHDKYDYQPPVPIRFAFGEYLASFFDNNSADIIIAENSLDHSINPLRCILEAYSVLKIGGLLSLRHYAVEGLLGYGKELHQWDFFLDYDNDFIIASKDNKINVSRLLAPYAVIKTYEEENSIEKTIDVVVNIEKKQNLSSDCKNKYLNMLENGILFEKMFELIVKSRIE